LNDLASFQTVGEAKRYLSKFSDDEPFEDERLATVFYEEKGTVFMLTWHYLTYRLRQFISDLLHLDAERLSTILFITIISWLAFFVSAIFHASFAAEIEDIAKAGLYASAIAGGAHGAVGALKSAKSLGGDK
jgi:hypothetical protein